MFFKHFQKKKKNQQITSLIHLKKCLFPLSLCCFLICLVFIQVTFGEQVTFTFGNDDSGKSIITKFDAVSGLTLTINVLSSNSLSDYNGLSLKHFDLQYALAFSFNKAVTLKSILFGYVSESGGLYPAATLGTEIFSFSGSGILLDQERTFQNEIKLSANETIQPTTDGQGQVLQIESITIEVNSEVVGDPHIIGLDGSKFDFTGVPGKIYSIISCPGFQLNVEFIESEGFTYLGQIGAIFQNNDSLIYHPSGELFFNGKKVDSSMEWMTKETI